MTDKNIVKRLVESSVGAISETQISKDLSKFFVDQVVKRKEEMLKMIREEMAKALKEVDFAEIAKEILKDNELTITVQVKPGSKKVSRKRSPRTP
jgi:arginine repressor